MIINDDAERAALMEYLAEQWHGIDLQLQIEGFAFAFSEMTQPIGLIDLGPPTAEELVAGEACRTYTITPDEAWARSTCVFCRLPLMFHPAGRKRDVFPKRRYCWTARRRARRAHRQQIRSE
jgi:hypothetical protein